MIKNMADLILKFDSTGQNLDASSSINISALSISGASPLADQYLNTNGLNVLQWSNKPLIQSDIKQFLVYTASNFNLNAGVGPARINFQAVSAFNSIGAGITYDGVNLFTINTPGVYSVMYHASCLVSSSNINVRLDIDGIPVNLTQITNTANACDLYWVGNLVATDTIEIQSSRVSGTVAKNTLTSTIAGPLVITRLA